MVLGTLAWTIELYMTKYTIGEIFSSGGATLYKNPSDPIVSNFILEKKLNYLRLHVGCDDANSMLGHY